jgi:hypothetical protein
MPAGGQAQKGAELGMAVQLAQVQYPLGRDAKHPPDPAYSTPLTPHKMDTRNGIIPLRLSKKKNEQVTNRKPQTDRMAQEANAGWKHPDMLT